MKLTQEQRKEIINSIALEFWGIDLALKKGNQKRLTKEQGEEIINSIALEFWGIDLTENTQSTSNKGVTMSKETRINTLRIEKSIFEIVNNTIITAVFSACYIVTAFFC